MTEIFPLQLQHFKKQRLEVISSFKERQRARNSRLSPPSSEYQLNGVQISSSRALKRRRLLEDESLPQFKHVAERFEDISASRDATSTKKPAKNREKNINVNISETIQDKDSIRNDYQQHFIDTSQRPHNFIRDSELSARFDEYPKLKELTRLKNEMVEKRGTPPTYLQADLHTFDLKSLGSKFDVILIDPPLEEYARRSAVTAGKSNSFWSFDEVAALKIEEVAANPSFIWIWCGGLEGLDRGRQLLTKWGYRRCEDIVWIKTNRTWEGTRFMEEKSVLQHTKEHCLMGIKGTVRRSTDGHFIHCNVDTDVIISDEPELGSTQKPIELYHIIEHFCLGRRRLELFGEDHNIRRGWLTIGASLTASNFNADTYASFFTTDSNGYLLGSTPKIEELRPKSPPPRDTSKKAQGAKVVKPMGPPTGMGSIGIGMPTAINPMVYRSWQ